MDIGLRNCIHLVCLRGKMVVVFCLSVNVNVFCGLHSCVNVKRPACLRFTPQSQCIVCQCWLPSSSRWLLLSNTHRSFNSSALRVSNEQSCCRPPRPARALSSVTTFFIAACSVLTVRHFTSSFDLLALYALLYSTAKDIIECQ